jgi:hypothetical protein
VAGYNVYYTQKKEKKNNKSKIFTNKNKIFITKRTGNKPLPNIHIHFKDLIQIKPKGKIYILESF